MNKYLVLALAGILVVALGGTAAASGYVITKPSQIKPSVRKALKGQRGPVGPQGTQGPQGPNGQTGAAGPQGPKGDAGARGDTGATGPQGPKGDTGARGDTGATGPHGPKGETGERGPQGPAGADGSDATRLGVLDARGNRLGDYLSGADSRGVGGTLTLLNRSDGRVYTIGTDNGNYVFPSVRFVFKTNNCSGPGYVHVSDVASPQNVFTRPGTGSPGDPMYVLGDTQQTITYHSYYGLNGGGCWDTSSSPYSPIPA